MTYTTIDVDSTTPEGRGLIRSVVREIADDRKHDPWGSGMLALGCVVDVLWAFGEGVPSAIATPGMGGGGEIDPDDSDAQWLYELVESGQLSTDEVRYAMFVLDRYLDIVRAAGRDY